MMSQTDRNSIDDMHDFTRQSQQVIDRLSKPNVIKEMEIILMVNTHQTINMLIIHHRVDDLVFEVS